MAAPMPLSAEDVLRVNGSRRFAASMATASPFASLADALLAARRIWLDEVCHLLAFVSSTSRLYYSDQPRTSASCCTDVVLATRARATNRIKVDVNGWLEAFAAHPAIGTTSPSVSKSVEFLPSHQSPPHSYPLNCSA
jgi:5-hydroxyisourate hydrolase/2-oxo-4-hydroxy-4-carboxy-5-ureidoimidazoline decarboxylase